MKEKIKNKFAHLQEADLWVLKLVVMYILRRLFFTVQVRRILKYIQIQCRKDTHNSTINHKYDEMGIFITKTEIVSKKKQNISGT